MLFQVAAINAKLWCVTLCLQIACDQQMQGIMRVRPILLCFGQYDACTFLMTSNCKASSTAEVAPNGVWSATLNAELLCVPLCLQMAHNEHIQGTIMRVLPLLLRIRQQAACRELMQK